MPISNSSLEESLIVNGSSLLDNGLLSSSSGTIAGVDYLADSDGYILQDSLGVFLQSAD